MADELLTIEDVEDADEGGPWSDRKKARAQGIFDGAMAKALRVAPCLKDPQFAGWAEARSILIEAVIRAVSAKPTDPTQTSESAAIFSHSRTFVDRSSLPTLTRGDIADLRALCPARRRRMGTIRLRVG